VEKFKLEGAPYRKSSAGGASHVVVGGDPSTGHKLPFTGFGKPSGLQVSFTLYQRMLASVFNTSSIAAVHLFMRLLLLPCCYGLLWLFYHNIQNNQWTFVSRNGLLFNTVLGAYFCSIITTATTYPMYRTRYYQEAQEGLYSGPLFLLSYWLFSLPFSFLAVAAGSRILFEVTGLTAVREWCLVGAVVWACYLLGEQLTVALLMVVRSSFTAALSSLYITLVCLLIGSGALRSYRGMSEWLVYLTYGTQARYAGAFLSQQLLSHSGVGGLALDNCTSTDDALYDASSFTCRYPDGAAFVSERYGRDSPEFHLSDVIDSEFNLSLAFAFPISFAIANCLLYLIPLPAFTKAKFRD